MRHLRFLHETQIICVQCRLRNYWLVPKSYSGKICQTWQSVAVFCFHYWAAINASAQSQKLTSTTTYVSDCKICHSSVIKFLAMTIHVFHFWASYRASYISCATSMDSCFYLHRAYRTEISKFPLRNSVKWQPGHRSTALKYAALISMAYETRDTGNSVGLPFWIYCGDNFSSASFLVSCLIFSALFGILCKDSQLIKSIIRSLPVFFVKKVIGF